MKRCGNAITGVDICRMVKRRLKDAGLPNRLSPHSFRVATVTDLLTQGVPLEDVQSLAGHPSMRGKINGGRLDVEKVLKTIGRK